jgi:putative oxidoreductase
MVINETALQAWTPRMLSVLRIVAALVFLQYGLSKYFGFPAHPPANFTMFSLIGLAGAIELVGSLFLLVGLFSREAAFIMSGEIAVAYFMRKAPNSFFPQVNGGGLEVLICFVLLFLFFAGPGPWSIDAWRRASASRGPTT